MLKGTLDDFTLSDIFRLLSFTKKTGKLEVVRRAGDGRVYFRDGEVYFAQTSIKREPLGQKLIRAGALTESELMRALDLNAQTGERVGEILLQQGSISEEQLAAGLRGQIEDAVFDLLRWEVGDFEFEAHERFVVEIPISVSVENLIMEAARRLDELRTIQKKIPSPEVVLAVAPSPPEGAREINITPDEWRLLVLVDGTKSVGEICAAANLDEFAGFRTLYGLLSSGLVDVASLGPAEAASPIAWPPLESLPGDPEGAVAAGEDSSVAGPRPIDVPGAGDDTYDVVEPATAGPGLRPEDHGFGEPPDPDAVAGVSSGPSEVVVPVFGIDDNDAPGGGDEGDLRAADPLDPDFAGMFDPRPPVEADESVGEPASLPDHALEPAPPDSPLLIGPPDHDEQDTFLTDILNGDIDEVAPPGRQAESPADPPPGDADAVPDRSGGAGHARVDRAAVVRELAGLFHDEELPARRPRHAQESDAGPENAARPSTKRRVEDDEEINKGLIGRIIDGVKGM